MIRELTGNLVPMGEMIDTYRILIVKREGKGPVSTPWRWERNIKLYLQGGVYGVDRSNSG